MDTLIRFFNQWFELFLFNQDIVHNIFLILVYCHFSIILITLCYKRRNSSLTLAKKNILLRLLGNFLLCSFLLLTIKLDTLTYIKPTGWLFDNIVLSILLGLIILSFFLYFFKKFKNKEWSFNQITSELLTIIFIEFLLFSSIVIIKDMITTSTFELSSPIIQHQIKNQPTAIYKVRKRTDNGVENGISSYITSFIITAVDIPSGERIWSNSSSWQEYLVGDTSEGLLILDRQKETLSFLDPSTGKKKMQEKELVERIPELADNLSYSESDYFLANSSEIYFHGLDGFYYKIDLSKNTVTKDQNYQELLSEHWRSDINKELDNFEDREKFKNLYPELMETYSTKLDFGPDKKLIIYQQKRNDRNRTLALISSKTHQIFWTVPLSNSESTNYKQSAFYKDNAYIYTWTDQYQYKINQKNGEIIYQYDYKTGRH